MKKSTKHNRSVAARSSFKRRGIHCAVLLVLGPALGMQAGAQSYINFDGSKTNDVSAALATWTTNPEFKFNPGYALIQGDWGLAAMNAQYAYVLGYSGKGVKLGSVDSGLLLSHEEFAKRGNVTAITISGAYLNDGSQNDGGGLAWKAGDVFNSPGSWHGTADFPNHIGLNDNHGSHVSGTIAAAKNGLDANGQGMMGVAFGSDYYITNSNGTDGSIYGSNMDYNYFYEAYSQLAKAGVRVINSSWGSPDSKDNVNTVAGMSAAYSNVESIGASGTSTKKSWLDAAADVSKQTGVIQVFAAGNVGLANPNIRASVPYFQPDIEKYWVAVAALNPDLTKASFSNSCGVAKYWCISAPGVNTNSLQTTDTGYVSESGTSMAAPHVTGAMGILMERYPSLDNQAIRTILLTTAKHLGDGSVDVPNETFGWGIPDLQKAMNGPGQFLGVLDANTATGISDTWSNNISEAALVQRKTEEHAEISAWQTTGQAALVAQLKPVPQLQAPPPTLVAQIPNAEALLKAVIDGNTTNTYGNGVAFNAQIAALNADPAGKQLLAAYEAAHPGWQNGYSVDSDYVNFIAGRSDQAVAEDLTNITHAAIVASNAAVQGQIDAGQTRITSLQSKTDADYVGSLIKTGAGTLTLTGDNSYSGGTQLQAGTLGVGSSTALGSGTLAISDAATLQAAADGLNLANAITLSGIGNIDTQAYGLTLSGNITDGATAGGLAKLGAGTLTLSGANTYSGPTGVMAGTLRAGSTTGFSPRSAFFIGTAGLLDLGNFNQSIGSLSGSGNVSLGAATLTTGADNSSTTFSGQIAGRGGLAKTGTGAFTLSSANTYAGGTALQAGQLSIGDSNALGTGSLSMDDGTTLGFSTNGLSVANNVLLTGTQAPIIDTGAFTETLGGVISGTGLLTKNGSGVLVTTGANTYSGATVVAAGTLQAGAVNTFSQASAVTVNTGATLNLAGYNQRIAGMNLAGTVSVAGATPGTLLTVTGPWMGNGGLLKLGTVSPTVSDHVLLSGATAVASGTTLVQIAKVVGLGAATTGNGIELIGTTGGANIQGNAFLLTGGQLVGGAYEYRLNNISSGGYLSSSTPQGQTYYRSEVPSYAALPAQLRQTNLVMLGNMHQRVGDDDVTTASGNPADTGSTNGNGNQRRAWGRVISTNLDIRQSGTVSPESRGGLDGYQVGTDLLSIRNWRAGVYVGELDGSMSVSGFARGTQNLAVGSNTLRNQYLGAYGTYTGDNGFYADGVLQSGRHNYDIVSPLTQTGSGGNGRGRSLLASVEVGQTFALDSAGDWKIEPQFQLIHQHLNLDDVAISGNTVVQQHPESTWLARLGVRIKGEVGVGVGRLQPYARVNLYRASGGNDVTSFATLGGRTAIASSTGGTTAELAAGATLALTPTLALYGEIGKLWSAGGETQTKTSVQGSVGARVLW